MSLLRTLASKGCRVLRSHGDGHCLIYSVCSSWTGQLYPTPAIDPEHVQSHIFIETVNNVDQYVPFIQPANRLSLITRLKGYLINKHYNQSFGDILPAIISNALQVSLNIFHENSGHDYERITVDPWVNRDNQGHVDIHRSRDHYNSIVPIIKPTNNLPQSTTYQCAAIFSPNTAVFGKSSSKDSIPVDNIVRTQHPRVPSDISGVPHPTRISYSAEQLKSFRTGRLPLKRYVRKSLFHFMIWLPALERSSNSPTNGRATNMNCHGGICSPHIETQTNISPKAISESIMSNTSLPIPCIVGFNKTIYSSHHQD